MRRFPTAEAYIRAVQQPDRALRIPTLAGAEFAIDPLGVPMPAAGAVAVVFRIALDDVDWALRFFLAEVSSKAHYEALQQHIMRHDLADLVVLPRWIDDAIEVDGDLLPAVQMQWIVGTTLDAHVDLLVGEGAAVALRDLAEQWRRDVKRLQTAGFAHGDLQHGNVLVDSSGGLRLVDLDGSWVLGCQDQPPESGHRNFDLPNRPWGRWMDTFPALVIYTGLLALAQRPDLWRIENEGILFTQTDFLPPFSTETWHRLDAVDDPEVTAALKLLKDCCAPGWVAQGSLDDLLSARRGQGDAPSPDARGSGSVSEAWFAANDDPTSFRWWDGRGWTSRTWRRPETIFVSYSRTDREVVATLVEVLRAANLSVWLDDQLRGGDPWWSEIVERIRQAVVFVYAASDGARESRPCKLELDYAEQLGVPVLPVQVGEVRSKRVWPIMQRQVVDLRELNAVTAARLVAAATSMRSRRRPNPEPLPPVPPPPFEYLLRIPGSLSRSDLPRVDQRRILDELRSHLDDEPDTEIRRDICGLLSELAAHPDAVRRTIADVEAILAFEGRRLPPVGP